MEIKQVKEKGSELLHVKKENDIKQAEPLMLIKRADMERLL